MQQGLKHRIVGAAVFLAVASIVVPLIVHPKLPAPALHLVRKAIPVAPSLPLVASVKTPEVKTLRPVNTAYIYRTLSLPDAWVVQVGSFSNKRNASDWSGRLTKSGLDTFTRRVVNAQGKAMLKVFVGPVVNHEAILKIKQRIDHRYHTHGIVRKYEQ